MRSEPVFERERATVAPAREVRAELALRVQHVAQVARTVEHRFLPAFHFSHLVCVACHVQQRGHLRAGPNMQASTLYSYPYWPYENTALVRAGYEYV